VVKAFTEPRQHWQSLLELLREEYKDCFITFQQAGVEGIMKMTGLGYSEAERASQRGYGEPLYWRGTAEQKTEFIKRLEELGASVLQGGRFLHVSGHCSKGIALNWLTRQYQAEEPGRSFTTLAIGDSQNDVAMLEAADMALIIRSPVNDMPVIDLHQHCFYSSAYGPEGWAEGVRTVLDFLQNKNIIIN
jgi:mannosyl-3-phosphoglycerate phosphatase family protein